MRFLVFLISTIFSGFLFGQTAFYKLYSGEGYDRGEGIVQLEDSCYLVAGSSSSWGSNTDAFLLKLDKNGNFLWSNHYGGTESDAARRVLYVPDSCFYLVGYSNSFGSGDFDAYLVKTDLFGNLLWEKTYGTSAWERIHDAVLTSDSSIIMVGETQPLNGNLPDMYIVKVNQYGDTMWTKTIGGSGDDIAKSIIPINDTSFLISGQKYLEDSLTSKGTILCLDLSGNIIWTKFFGNQKGPYSIHDIALGADTNIYFAGARQVSDFNYDDYNGKADINGDLIIEVTNTDSDLSAPRSCIFDEIVVFSDQGKNLIGSRNKWGDTPPDFPYDVAFFLFENQYMTWNNEALLLYNDYEDWVGQILLTNDHSAVIVGTHSSTGAAGNTENGGSNIFVLKLGQNQTFPEINTTNVLNPIVHVGELSEQDDIHIFPNPFSDVLNIKAKHHFDFEINNLTGELLFSGNTSSMHNTQFSDLPKGVYFFRIKNVPTHIKLIKN